MKSLLQSSLLFLTTFLFSTMSWGQYSGAGTFEKITSLGDLTDGYYVILESNEDFAMNDTHNGTFLDRTSVNPSSDELNNPSGDIVWLIETNGSGRTIYNENSERYVSYTGSSNNVQVVNAISGNNQRWNITYSSNQFVFNNVAVSNRILQYNLGSPRFACYTSNQRKFSLYKLDEGSASSPILDADQFSLSNLDYQIDNGPSTEQSISVSGTNLDGSDVTVSVPVSSDFELAETASGSYSNSITIASFDGTADDIFVRLKSGLALNTYTDDITISGGGASDITVSLNGEVTPEPYDNEETFENYPETSGSYEDGSFTGVAGNTWNYVGARGDIDINAETVTLQNNSSSSLNSSISGGISVFEFDYEQAFSNNVNLEVYVNGSLATTVTSSSEKNTTKNSGQITVNESGTFTIEFKQGSGGNQVAIDNFKWNSFTSTTPEVGFDTASSTENETNSTFTVNIPVTLSNFNSNVDLSVSVDGSSTAEAGDYTLNTTSLSFTGNGTQNISLDINPDAGYDDETIILEIAETSSTGVTITTSQHTVTVLDDEIAPLGWQITTEDTDFVIDFDNTVAGVNNGQFDGTGFLPSPAIGQLNSEAWETTGMSDGNFNFGDTETSGDFARGSSTGGESSGGFYAFETSSNNFSLGFQGTGSDFTPGTITLRAQNQTGTTVTDVDLFYILYVYNDQGRANSFNFEYSTDGSNYTTVASLNFTSQEVADGSPVWTSNSKSTSISNLSIADDAHFYLRWESDDVSGSGSKDELAIDDITINFNPVIYIYDNGWNTDPVGVSTPANDIKVINGTANITQELVANNLEIASGATLNVAPLGVLNLAGNIINNGDLVFQSDATGSGQLASFTGTITGNLTAERYIPAKRAFRLTSSPVGGVTIANSWQQNTHITGSGGTTNGFDVTGSNNPSMFTFDNTIADQSNGAAWEAVTSTSDVISAGTPYRLFVRGDRTISLTDNAAPATVTTLSATGTMHTGSYSPTLATAANHYSFIGNPYQAVVDFNAVTTSNLTDYLYVWDASIAGTNGRGGYVTVQVSTGNITAPSQSTSAASEYIAPGQAFFVQNTGGGGGSVTFEETDKATTQSQVSIFSEYTNFYINSRLYKTSALQNGEMESDAIGLRFNEDYTTIGSEEDASKLANPGENYAIVNNGFKSIDKQNIPTDGHQIELILLDYESSNYSLTFDIANQPETLSVYLNDDYLNKKTELTENTIYDFTIDTNVPESIDRNRFHLSFQDVTLNNKNFDDSKVSLYPNPVVNQLQIKLPASVKVNSVQIFNLLGQAVQTSEESKIDVSQLISGIYLVEVETSSGKVTKKIIKK